MRYDDNGPTGPIHTLLPKFIFTCMTSGRYSVFNVMGLAQMGIPMLEMKIRVLEHGEIFDKVFQFSIFVFQVNSLEECLGFLSIRSQIRGQRFDRG